MAQRPLAAPILACNHVDPDEIQACLNVLFAGLPPAVQILDVAQVLRDAEWCYVEALEELGAEQLLDLALEPGQAAMVMRRLRPPVPVPVPQHAPVS